MALVGTMDIGGQTYMISDSLRILLMLSPLLFCIVLSIVGSIIRKKSNANFDKNVNPNIKENNEHRVYKSGYVPAFVGSSLVIITFVLLSVLVRSWVTVAYLFAVMFTIIFLGVIGHIPRLLFKCPKCQKRKLECFRKINHLNHRTSKKLYYFRCKDCGFETVEYVFASRDTSNN